MTHGDNPELSITSEVDSRLIELPGTTGANTVSSLGELSVPPSLLDKSMGTALIGTPDEGEQPWPVDGASSKPIPSTARPKITQPRFWE